MQRMSVNGEQISIGPINTELSPADPVRCIRIKVFSTPKGHFNVFGSIFINLQHGANYYYYYY